MCTLQGASQASSCFTLTPSLGWLPSLLTGERVEGNKMGGSGWHRRWGAGSELVGDQSPEEGNSQNEDHSRVGKKESPES